MLETLILFLLLNKSYTMYTIRKHIKDDFGAFMTPSFGGLNPALKRLEKKEFIKSGKLMSEGGRMSIFYEITPDGKKELIRQLIEDLSLNPYHFFLSARLRIAMAFILNIDERKRLFLIIKSRAQKFKTEAQKAQIVCENPFYYNIVKDNITCEYSNLITLVESLEKDNGRNS